MASASYTKSLKKAVHTFLFGGNASKCMQCVQPPGWEWWVKKRDASARRCLATEDLAAGGACNATTGERSLP